MEEAAKEDMWPQESRKGKKMDFLLELPEEIQLCQYPDFSSSDLQNHRKINFWSFKPLSLRYIVAIENNLKCFYLIYYNISLQIYFEI